MYAFQAFRMLGQYKEVAIYTKQKGNHESKMRASFKNSFFRAYTTTKRA